MAYKRVAAAAFALAGLAGAPAFAQDADLAAEGEKVFRRCQACHQVGPEAKNRVGPALTDVIGRTAGTLADFRYSDAMVAAGEGGLVWDEETLFAYLEDPKGLVEGTNMAFAGLKKEEDRTAVIEYIKSQQAGAS